MKERILGVLGLANRGGNILFGESIFYSLPKGKVKLVILASDASANTTKKVMDKTTYYVTEVATFATKAELGHALGKGEIAVLGVMDVHLAKKLKTLLKDDENE
jgi:ribosomal protein L7Ae-like RNA K-turn-binding protein